MKNKWIKTIILIIMLYIFFMSITLIGDTFKHIGKDRAKDILNKYYSNCFVALFLGILATSIVQSSSTVTSITVGLVGTGVIPIHCAIPIVMGANVGTSVTNLFVSIGHITRVEEFKRAIHAATVHDLFNFMAIGLLFPVEIITRSIFGKGFLEICGKTLGGFLSGTEGVKFTSPLKAIVNPPADMIITMLDSLHMVVFAILSLGIAFTFLFIALYFIVKLMKSIMVGKVEVMFDRIVGHNAFQGLFLGLIVTAIVQSSSITTSLLVPLAAAGVLSIHQVFSVTLGANIGTTFTALLASLAAGPGGIVIALIHLFFNVSATIIFWPGHIGGKLPIWLAGHVSRIAVKKRYFLFIYIGVLFFLIPVILIVLYNIFSGA